MQQPDGVDNYLIFVHTFTGILYSTC